LDIVLLTITILHDDSIFNYVNICVYYAAAVLLLRCCCAARRLASLHGGSLCSMDACSASRLLAPLCCCCAAAALRGRFGSSGFHPLTLFYHFRNTIPYQIPYLE
jgi:hypothetical protein